MRAHACIKHGRSFCVSFFYTDFLDMLSDIHFGMRRKGKCLQPWLTQRIPAGRFDFQTRRRHEPFLFF